MAIKPILFNTEMVRAILDGRKGATRRIVKGFIPDDAVWGYTAFTPKGYISCRGTFADGYGEKIFKLPCETGDILYVRETWKKAPNGYYYYEDWQKDDIADVLNGNHQFICRKKRHVSGLRLRMLKLSGCRMSLKMEQKQKER